MRSFLGSLRSRTSRSPSSTSSAVNEPLVEDSKAIVAARGAGGAINDEPPPAYAAVAPRHAPPTPLPSNEFPPQVFTNDSDPYAFLSFFDTVFLIDDSGSMTGPNWRETEAALRAITPICTAHDADGVDLYFLNHRSCSRPTDKSKADGGYYNIRDPGALEDIFDKVLPYGVTPTATRLQTILKPYLASLSAAKDRPDTVRPVNIIVITDGRATDDPESVIVQAAKKLDALDAPPHQVGIQFFQVGRDRGAREALRELDDDLAQLGVRDMVDAVTWDSIVPMNEMTLSADGILKVVLGAVNRRLDRKPGMVR